MSSRVLLGFLYISLPTLDQLERLLLLPGLRRGPAAAIIIYIGSPCGISKLFYMYDCNSEITIFKFDGPHGLSTSYEALCACDESLPVRLLECYPNLTRVQTGPARLE